MGFRCRHLDIRFAQVGARRGCQPSRMTTVIASQSRSPTMMLPVLSSGGAWGPGAAASVLVQGQACSAAVAGPVSVATPTLPWISAEAASEAAVSVHLSRLKVSTWMDVDPQSRRLRRRSRAWQRPQVCPRVRALFPQRFRKGLHQLLEVPSLPLHSRPSMIGSISADSVAAPRPRRRKPPSRRMMILQIS